LLRSWRERRRRSQLDLASEAEVSTRHLSFVETGRSQPSRELLLHLAEHLEVPLRDRNELLLAAGYAPTYPAADINSAEMAPVREALELMLGGHEPRPAVVFDGGWNLVMANGAASVFLEGIPSHVLEPTPNVAR
jgi:transcriptional regulator with XRE-family HTH domain